MHHIKITALSLVLLSGCFGDPEAAKSAARAYAKDMGYEVVGVSCTGTDTDGDGYVSCTLQVKGHQDPIALECTRGEFTFTSGCKVAMPKLRVSTTNINTTSSDK